MLGVKAALQKGKNRISSNKSRISYGKGNNMSEEEIEVVMNALSGTPTVTTSDFANKVEYILRNYREDKDE